MVLGPRKINILSGLAVAHDISKNGPQRTISNSSCRQFADKFTALHSRSVVHNLRLHNRLHRVRKKTPPP